MDSQTKRTLAATVLCLVVLFGWFRFQQAYYPQEPWEPGADLIADAGATSQTATQASQPIKAGGIERTVARGGDGRPQASIFEAVSAGSSNTIKLGDDRQDRKDEGFHNPYEFEAIVSPIGAGVESINLSRRRNHVATDPRHPDHDPYNLLSPVEVRDSGRVFRSFVTEKIRLVDEKQDVSLKDVVWSAEQSKDDRGEEARLSTVIQRVDGDEDVLRLTKTYRLEKGEHHLKISLDVENLCKKPRQVIITERGPIGLAQASSRTDGRMAMVAQIGEDGRIVAGGNVQRAALLKAEDRAQEFPPGEAHTVWSAVSNIYFSCIETALPLAGSEKTYPAHLARVTAKSYTDDADAGGDLTLEQVFAPEQPIAAGDKLTIHIEAFCGPKSGRLFDTIPSAVARRYDVVSDPDQSPCTFDILSRLMVWLLDSVHSLVGNYGIAIIILVIIVRLVLHPVSKRGQIHMMKMQKNTQRLKPRLEALQQQFKNDKQKLNEETMKLYREEGINPAGSVMGCLPMLLQTPIWIALYTTLYTNVDLRHMPFFGYIRDLSAPDALITFATPFHVPVAGWAIGSFNLLPLLMAGIMYAQQKFTQKLTKPDKPIAPKLDADGNPLPDTMAQQQKIMSFMMIFMGLIFYNFPSGLCLYILSSSLLGMAEQYFIRKHIREKESEGGFEPKAKAPKQRGFFARKLEDLQKKAEQARLSQATNPQIQAKKRRKKKRF